MRVGAEAGAPRATDLIATPPMQPVPDRFTKAVVIMVATPADVAGCSITPARAGTPMTFRSGGTQPSTASRRPTAS